MTEGRERRTLRAAEPETELGRRIDEVRAERGWTVGDVERRAGVSKGHISRLRLGDRTAEGISVASAFAIADALEVEARWLFLGQGPKTALSGARLAEAHRLVKAAADLLAK